MNELAGLLRAIVDNPHDPAPRLIFADWLEEQGRGERAEFIRLDDESRRLHAFVQEWASVPGRAEDGEKAGASLAYAQRMDGRIKELALFTTPPSHLSFSFDCPLLADVLRAWCGVWPHADDSLRELVVWWLGAVEWDHARAAKVQEARVKKITAPVQPIWITDPRLVEMEDDGTIWMRGKRYWTTLEAAVRDLKRRVLSLFPEVEWSLEYRIAYEKWFGLKPEIEINRLLSEAGFRLNFREPIIKPSKPELEVSRDASTDMLIYSQTLAAPDWIAPEPLTADELRNIEEVGRRTALDWAREHPEHFPS